MIGEREERAAPVHSRALALRHALLALSNLAARRAIVAGAGQVVVGSHPILAAKKKNMRQVGVAVAEGERRV